MKTILFALLAFTLSASPALAELRLPPPDQLVKKASSDRIALREVILDITKNIPEIRDPRTFDSYFNLLGELSRLAQLHRLDEIYPGAVSALGDKMAANGVRWLKIEEDSTDRVLYFHRWMSINTAAAYQGEIERVALSEKAPDKLRVLATNTEAVAAWSEVNYPNETRTNANYGRILSEVAGQFLKFPNLPEEEAIFWIGKVSYPEPFAMVLENLQKTLFALDASNISRTHEILRRLTQIKARVTAAGNRMPFYIHSMIGEVSQELILRMTKHEEIFNEGEFKQALALLENRYLQGLGTLWIARAKLPSGAYAPHFFKLSRELALALYQAGFGPESDQVNSFVGRIAAPIMGRSLNIEGTYDLTDTKGKKWLFSLALARETLYYAALNDAAGFVHKPFLYVEYDFETGGFVASAREKDSDPFPIWTLHFKVNGKKIEVTDPWGTPENYPLKGEKIQAYPDYFLQAGEPTGNPSGRYTGEVTFGDGLKKKMTLIVTGFNGYTVGRLTDQDYLNIDLNVGSVGTNGVLYLTTGVNRATWTQLRGVLKNGEYRGVVIIGGREMTKEFVLKKVKEAK